MKHVRDYIYYIYLFKHKIIFIVFIQAQELYLLYFFI